MQDKNDTRNVLKLENLHLQSEKVFQMLNWKEIVSCFERSTLSFMHLESQSTKHKEKILNASKNVLKVCYVNTTKRYKKIQ